MRQGRRILPWCAAIALIACGALTPVHASAAKSAGANPSAPASPRARASLRQFSGYVTALDKTSLTVEKRGKKPESKSFTKHATMSTVGEVQKEARVTVFYRDEDGHAVAHRVIVKEAGGSASGGR